MSTLLLAGLLPAAPPAGAAEAPVGLGTAGAYSVLGGQAVTNTGPSTLDADLGVSPGTAITGFPPGTVGGSTHAGDAPAAQAQSDLATAYNDAAGRAPTASVAGDLVGRTLTAGVYNSTGPLALSGTLTLNGQGNPNSVFIFQVASTLITASASHVNVLNGAQACHVFWQVGSSATLGTNSTFQGTVMALTSISVTTGTTVAGRALARNGAVTLDDNTFTTPDCATTPTPSPTPTPTHTPTPTPTHTTPTHTTPPSTTTARPPTVIGISPGQGGSGGGTVVTVTGTGFVPGHTSVTIGGTTIPASAVTVTSPTTLTFRTPAHAAGPVTLTVSTPSGTSGPLSFSYLPGAVLAATGSTTSGLALLAGLLLVTGSAVLFFTRRQAAARHRH